jgi:hypothetical protein
METNARRGAAADGSLTLAAARALWRTPQRADRCWADVRRPGGGARPCGRPEASSLGLCAQHRLELFGPPSSHASTDAGAVGVP